MLNKKFGFASLTIILVIIILGVVGYVFYQNSQTSDQTADWKTYTDSAQIFSFKYPEKLSTVYIKTQEWPPSVKIATGNFSCAGRETLTTPVFCVVAQEEPAAGTFYTSYAYTTTLDDKLVTFNFILRQPNDCGPIPDVDRQKCLDEERSFSVDNLVQQIFATFKFIN